MTVRRAVNFARRWNKREAAAATPEALLVAVRVARKRPRPRRGRAGSYSTDATGSSSRPGRSHALGPNPTPRVGLVMVVPPDNGECQPVRRRGFAPWPKGSLALLALPRLWEHVAT